jgi:SpoVK/Ycf46/Vps4 family AAA+-type ATPase
MDYISLITDGYSNSDLQELCRNAVMVPVREAIRSSTSSAKTVNESTIDVKSLKIRAVTVQDFTQFVDNLYSKSDMTTLPEPVD